MSPSFIHLSIHAWNPRQLLCITQLKCPPLPYRNLLCYSGSVIWESVSLFTVFQFFHSWILKRRIEKYLIKTIHSFLFLKLHNLFSKKKLLRKINKNLDYIYTSKKKFRSFCCQSRHVSKRSDLARASIFLLEIHNSFLEFLVL